MAAIVGWDIGGAHLKAVRAEAGRIVAAVQVPSPLRMGLPRLAQAFAEAKSVAGRGDLHLVTMTGELADTFVSRADGVENLVQTAVRELAPDPVRIYAGRSGIMDPEQAGYHVDDIASANWHATASLVARSRPAALFMDMGSTTTDIVPASGGAVLARGYTDAERLATGELVYTGLVRSFLMATAERVPFAGTWQSLIKENFATMADVHRILGPLPEGADQMPTADGREKSSAASRVRLARMIGRDGSEPDDAARLARWFAEMQIRAVTDGAHLVLSQGSLPASAAVIGAGIGHSVLREVARRLGRDYVAFEDLLDAPSELRSRAAYCAPAAALAVLGPDGM